MKQFYSVALFIFLLLFNYNKNAIAQNKHLVDSLQSIISTTKNDTVRINSLVSLSMLYQGIHSDMAFDFGTQALKLSAKINYKKGLGNAHNVLGDNYWYKGEFLESSENYLKALHIFEELNNKLEIAGCYRNIGWIYFNQKNNAVALDYYVKSLKINEAAGYKNGIAQNLNDISIIHKNQKNYTEALIYLKKSIALQKELNNVEGLVANYGNLGDVYRSLKKNDLAIESVEESAKYAYLTGNKQHLSITLSNLGYFYSEAGRYDIGIATLEKGLNYAREIEFKDALLIGYQNFANTYAKKHDYQKAYLYADSCSILKDSIYNGNNSRQINEMTAKYDSEKKELMINSLEKDKALSEEKLEHEKNFKIYLSVFCLMIVAFAFFLLKGNVQKKKANEKLSHAYKEIEEKNKDITDSINYSKRIQDASLPPKELKYRIFPDAFVYFHPKDIVSGDFYWYAEKNGKRIIAACDCTGHGVPGALMSMIGSNILNQLVNEKGITSADEILNQLHIEVRRALKQDENEQNRDGMDVALLVFHSETELEYAGAQRPLWLIKNSQNPNYNPEVVEYKSDKFSIGGLQLESERIFSKTKLKLDKGDSLYIFTDGYADQFGGTEGKKFMTKHLKQLFITIHSEPMATQELVVDKTLEKWRGDQEQVDDILVIGIKI